MHSIYLHPGAENGIPSQQSTSLSLYYIYFSKSFLESTTLIIMMDETIDDYGGDHDDDTSSSHDFLFL